MLRCERQSQEAYHRGDHAAAKALSLKARDCEARAKRVSERAAAEIFRAHNNGRPDGEVDLHGL